MREVRQPLMSLPSEMRRVSDKPADAASVGGRCVRERQEPTGSAACRGGRGRRGGTGEAGPSRSWRGRGRRGRPWALGIEASELLTSVVGRGSLSFVPARDLPG